jgi:hypothetical protein
MIGKRKIIARDEVRSAHILRANIGLEIGLGLVGAVYVGAEGKPCREIMHKRESDAHIFVVRAQIEKLGEASDRNQTKFCPFPGAIIRQDKVFSREK